MVLGFGFCVAAEGRRTKAKLEDLPLAISIRQIRMVDLRKVAPERICGSGRVKPPATRQRRSQLRTTSRTLVRKKERPPSPRPRPSDLRRGLAGPGAA